MPVFTLVEAASKFSRRGALIGLDLGTKTIGVATSDPDRCLAAGVETIRRTTFAADARRILLLPAQRRGRTGPPPRPAAPVARRSSTSTRPPTFCKAPSTGWRACRPPADGAAA